MKNAVISTIFAVGTLGMSAIASAADFSSVPAGKYSVDPAHAYMTFSYNHLGFSNPVLSFDEFSIDLDLDNEDPTKSSVTVVIAADSIVAGSDIWKEHLSGEKFFDFANHPEITFSSTSVEAARDGNYKVMGDLNIKGVSKPVALDVTINGAANHPMSGKPVIGLEANSEIMRSEFGFEQGIPAVGDAISLHITAEMVQGG